MSPETILKSTQLPSRPAVAVRLLQLCREPQSDMAEVIRAVQADPAISAKILRAANSARFSFRSKVESIERAVPLLGTATITTLAISFSLTEDSMPTSRLRDLYEAYWRQSLVQASAAEVVLSNASRDARAEYFLTGLLLDIGTLAMMRAIPDEYFEISGDARETGRQVHEVETQVLGFDHSRIGASLLDSWGLPEKLVSAVRHHHRPLDDLETPGGVACESIRVAVFATAAGAYFCEPSKGVALESLNEIGSHCFGMESAQIQRTVDQISERVSNACELFDVDSTRIPSSEDLLTEANDQLLQRTLSQHEAQQESATRQRTYQKNVRQLEEQNRKLRSQALTDPLTQCYNRAYFDSVFDQEASRCVRTGNPIAVMFLDVDHFKNVNDRYGHSFGDDVLRGIAGSIRESIREEDTLARYGGEEFVILMDRPSIDALHVISERVRSTVESTSFIFEKEQVPVTISIGCSMGSIERAADSEILLSAADTAMYQAKKQGRNQVCIEFRDLICRDSAVIQ